MAFDPDGYLAKKTGTATSSTAPSGFNPDEYLQAKNSGSPIMDALKKANQVGGQIAQTGLDVLNAPFEVAGEAMRLPVEGILQNGLAKPLSDFRAPTILQKAIPALRTDQPPENPFSVANKSLQAAGGFVAGLPGGLDSAVQGARSGYTMDRGIGGPIADTALALLSGKLTPQVANAPLDAAVKGGESLLAAGKDAAKFVGKKAIRAGLGPTEEAQSALMNRPDAVLSKTNFDDLADHFAQTANDLSQKVDALDEKAWKQLSKVKAEPKQKIVDLLESVKQQFIGNGESRIGDADKKAVAQIDRYIERITPKSTPDKEKAIGLVDKSGQEIKRLVPGKKGEEFLDQPQLRELLISIRKDTRFDLPDTDPVNRAVQAAQGKLDSYLKKRNPEYEAVMTPVAKAMDALKSAASKFRLGQKHGEGFVSTDTTAQKLSALGREKKPETNRILENLKQETGRDFADEARLTRFKEEFKSGKENSRGSARTLAGSVVGAGIGNFLGMPTVGAAAGGLTGRALDYYGGSITQQLIQALQAGQNVAGQAANTAGASPGVGPLIALIRALGPLRAVSSPVASYGASRQSNGR
jgi:hypothetical protein